MRKQEVEDTEQQRPRAVGRHERLYHLTRHMITRQMMMMQKDVERGPEGEQPRLSMSERNFQSKYCIERQLCGHPIKILH